MDPFTDEVIAELEARFGHDMVVDILTARLHRLIFESQMARARGPLPRQIHGIAS